MLYQRDGLEALQNARLVRLIEEAYFQGAFQGTHFPLATLSLFANRVAKANRQRLLPLWEAEVRLPVAGQSRRCREKISTGQVIGAISVPRMSVMISEEELKSPGQELVNLARAVSRKMGWPEEMMQEASG